MHQSERNKSRTIKEYYQRMETNQNKKYVDLLSPILNRLETLLRSYLRLILLREYFISHSQNSKVGIQNFGTEASCIFDRWDLVGTSKQDCHTQHKSDIWPDFKSAPKRSISHDSKFVFPDFWQMFLSPRLPDTFPKCRDAWLLMAFVCRNFGHMRIVNYVPSDSAIQIKRWKGGQWRGVKWRGWKASGAHAL